jgi:hypothetical protein
LLYGAKFRALTVTLEVVAKVKQDGIFVLAVGDVLVF